jgi:hypothetical protein
MTYVYTPRAMPSRYLEGAPDVVLRNVIDLVKITPAAPLDYDIVFRPDPADMADPYRAEITGLDFGTYGARGQHFFLTPAEMRAYRDRNRRNRVAWSDLPEATRAAILRYLEG